MATQSGRGSNTSTSSNTRGDLMKQVELYDGTKAYFRDVGGYVQGKDGKYYPAGYDASFTSQLTGTTYTPSVDEIADYTKKSGTRGNPTKYTFDKDAWEIELVKKDADVWKQSELDKQKTYIEQQRAIAEQERGEQIQQFNEKEAASKKASEDQKAAFESDRLSREKAFNDAQAEKAKQLGIQRAGNASTMLADYSRVRDGENKLVANEDKKQLSSDDKDKMFGDVVSDDVVKKVKQTFLERLKSK